MTDKDAPQAMRLSATWDDVDLKWVSNPASKGLYDLMLDGRMVAWLVPRPYYCDRGHWQVNCELPDIDAQDGFPRYFMQRAVAIEETERFIRWRLTRRRGD